ncbi:MAG: SDR family NAD(P)-dependent oxidoreductase [Geminicoccaceae bacterium]
MLISGGASGIGKAIAFAFRDFGAEVTSTASSDEKAAMLEAEGIRAVRADVARENDVIDLVDSQDRIDILITAAGIVKRIEEYQLKQFDEVMQVNLYGTARMALLARDKLARSNGCIVTIASMLSTFGDPLVPAYCASKGAVTQLTKSLATEYARDGVRVNAIAPGWIATPMVQALIDDPVHNDPIMARTPMDRWGKPEEIAQGALFLASPAASFITGATLTVDGGYSIN